MTLISHGLPSMYWNVWYLSDEDEECWYNFNTHTTAKHHSIDDLIEKHDAIDYKV
jgi:hypothetical protein